MNAPPLITYPARPIQGGRLELAPPKRGLWYAPGAKVCEITAHCRRIPIPTNHISNSFGAYVAADVLVRLVPSRLRTGDEDEAPTSCLTFRIIRFQNGLRGRPRAGEEIKDEIVGSGGLLNQYPH